MTWLKQVRKPTKDADCSSALLVVVIVVSYLLHFNLIQCFLHVELNISGAVYFGASNGLKFEKSSLAA